MFRFNLSIIVLPITAVALMATGCSQENPETQDATAANAPLASYHETRWESQQDYMECPDGASLRLMYKWLEVPHEGTLPDSCMSFNDAVNLVGQNLPKIKASIDANNAKIEADWQAFQSRIDTVMQQPPNAAVRVLLDLRCNDKSVDTLVETKLRWTPFLGTTPEEVRAAIDRIIMIDDEGYGITINVGHNDGSTTEEPYDEYWYQSTTNEAPMYVNEQGAYDQLPDSELYGSYGSKPYHTMLQSFYDGMRVRATDADGMPVYYESGMPLCMQ